MRFRVGPSVCVFTVWSAFCVLLSPQIRTEDNWEALQRFSQVQGESKHGKIKASGDRLNLTTSGIWTAQRNPALRMQPGCINTAERLKLAPNPSGRVKQNLLKNKFQVIKIKKIEWDSPLKVAIYQPKVSQIAYRVFAGCNYFVLCTWSYQSKNKWG